MLNGEKVAHGTARMFAADTESCMSICAACMALVLPKENTQLAA